MKVVAQRRQRMGYWHTFVFSWMRGFFLPFLLLKLQQRWPDDPIITSKAALTCSLCYQPSERGKWWDARQDKQRHFSHLVVQEQCRKRWRQGKGQKTAIRRRKRRWSRSWCLFHSIFLILTRSIILVSPRHDLPYEFHGCSERTHNPIARVSASFADVYLLACGFIFT